MAFRPKFATKSLDGVWHTACFFEVSKEARMKTSARFQMLSDEDLALAGGGRGGRSSCGGNRQGHKGGKRQVRVVQGQVVQVPGAGEPVIPSPTGSGTAKLPV
jgi:hypothetical protein